MEIKDLEYKELRLDLVDLTEGVVGSFLFYYDALYVNDGHVQHKRFLPIKYFSANGKKQLVSKYGAKRKGKKGGIGGVMLSERYIQGKFFLEKGAQSAKPRIERACDSWLRDTLREAIGALL